MAKYPYFQPLAGETHTVKFDKADPWENETKYGLAWTYVVIVDGGDKLYYQIYKSLKDLYDGIPIKNNDVITLKVLQERNPGTNKPYTIYEVTDSDGKVYSTSKRNQPAKSDGGEGYDERNPPPVGEEPTESLPAQPLDVPENEQVIFDRMQRCLDASTKISYTASGLEDGDVVFSPEDIRAMAISMFIEANKL